MNSFVELSPYTKVPANAGTLVVLEEDQIFLLAKSLAFFPAGSFSLRFPLRLTLGLFLGFAFRLTLGFFLSLPFGLPLSLFLGFAFRLALGLLLSLALGFLLRLTLRFTLSLFLGFAFRLALGFLFRLFLYFPLFLSSYATFLRRSFLPRNFPLLRALALRSFFP